MRQRHFTPAFFAFLRDLAKNNNRDWFKANKQRYEDSIREPALQFVRDFEARLEKISPHMVVDDRKVGGSLFRIYRDVRFSMDKTPYKTNSGIHFRHEAGKNAHCPGFYLHLDPKEIFVDAGVWRPDSETVGKIRATIDAEPKSWKSAVGRKTFASTYELAGDSLKRPPKGYEADHPLIDDLKRKDFIGVVSLSQKAVTRRGFIDEYTKLCRKATPLMSFLCRAIDVPY